MWFIWHKGEDAELDALLRDQEFETPEAARAWLAAYDASEDDGFVIQHAS